MISVDAIRDTASLVSKALLTPAGTSKFFEEHGIDPEIALLVARDGTSEAAVAHEMVGEQRALLMTVFTIGFAFGLELAKLVEQEPLLPSSA